MVFSRARQRFGFTLVELLIVLGIFSIIGVVTAPLIVSSLGKGSLKSATWEITDVLRRAQVQSMTGNGNSNWGVHFQSDRFVLFKGNTYSISDPDNVETVLSSTLSIAPISLNGGGSDVKFATKKGDTTQYGSVQIQDNGGNTATVSISAVGLITYTL